MAIELGDYVKLLRSQRNWTQEDLATVADMRQTHISAIEIGARRAISTQTATKLAAAFGVSLDDFQARRVPIVEGGDVVGMPDLSQVELALAELAASNPRLAKLVRAALNLPEAWQEDVFGALEAQLDLIVSLHNR